MCARSSSEPTPNPDGAISVVWAVAIPSLLLFIPLVAPMLIHRVFAHTDLGAFHLPLRHMSVSLV